MKTHNLAIATTNCVLYSLYDFTRFLSEFIQFDWRERDNEFIGYVWNLKSPNETDYMTQHPPLQLPNMTQL